jgi:hypothetical protein
MIVWLMIFISKWVSACIEEDTCGLNTAMPTGYSERCAREGSCVYQAG